MFALPERDVLLNAGTVISIAAMLAMVLIEYRFTLRTLIITLMTVLCAVPGDVLGQLMRKLTYGEWLDPISMITNFSEYEGTHFMGRALGVVAVAFLLWALVMRKETGTFSKHGRGRYLSMLSMYLLIQVCAGRLGCISANCCRGKVHYGWFSVSNYFVDAPVLPGVHTELTLALITLAVVVVLYIKRKDGFGVFCIGYALAVFIAEFMYDKSGTLKIADMSAVQIAALALMALGAVYMRALYKRQLAAGGTAAKRKYVGGRRPYDIHKPAVKAKKTGDRKTRVLGTSKKSL